MFVSNNTISRQRTGHDRADIVEVRLCRSNRSRPREYSHLMPPSHTQSNTPDTPLCLALSPKQSCTYFFWASSNGIVPSIQPKDYIRVELDIRRQRPECVARADEFLIPYSLFLIPFWGRNADKQNTIPKSSCCRLQTYRCSNVVVVRPLLAD